MWKYVTLAASVFVGLGILFRGPDIYHWVRESLEIGQTTGSIYVNSPQIYTRERLVNDRYREDAWLRRMLDDSSKRTYRPTASLSREERSQTTVTGQAGTAANQPETATAPAGPGGESKSEWVLKAELPPVMQLDAERAYREHIRKLAIENQLDDRHDLRGNSLYRLGFDVAVVPGRDTRKSAEITVSILPPEGLLDSSYSDYTDDDHLNNLESQLGQLKNLSELQLTARNVWDKIYLRWLDSLGKRFEDARRSLINSYDDNRFAPDQYDAVLESIRTTARLFANQINPLKVDANSLENIPSTHWSKESFVTLQQAIVTDFDSFIKPSYDSDTIDLFRSNYRLGNFKITDPAHRLLKSEIGRLIETVQKEHELLAYLNSKVNPAVDSATSQMVPENNECREVENDRTLTLLVGANQAASYDLRYFLDVAFEGAIARSVLGLLPDNPTLNDPTGTRLTSLTALSKFASVVLKYGSANRAFVFDRNLTTFDITDNSHCVANQQVIAIPVSGRNVFVFKDQIAFLQYFDPAYDWNSDVRELFRDPNAPPHFVTKVVQTGLINFIRTVGPKMNAYSYAFTPSEPDEVVAVKHVKARADLLSLGANLAAQNAQGRGSANFSEDTKTDREENNPRKSVISFGAQNNSLTPRFGWLIQPEDIADDGNSYRQRAAQYSLAALVSIPAWWDEIRVQVKRRWVDESGTPSTPLYSDSLFPIELPVNFDTIDASLFEFVANDRSPIIFEGVTEALTVRPCAEADIVIPGRRLWRSTVVTLGGQPADEIFVLPDMNGIVARFNKVQFPSGWLDSNDTHQEPLTVWTSQGSATLPIPVNFASEPKPEAGCPEEKKKDSQTTAEAPAHGSELRIQLEPTR